jgi:CubicO group peptidase (beta-lactamase class C family)
MRSNRGPTHHRTPQTPVTTLRHRTLRGPALAAALLLLATALPAQDDPRLARLIDRALQQHTSALGAGCTVGVQVDGRAITRALGMADLERAVPLSAESIIEAGSVSKQVTAMAILQLMADGKLALDDDVRRWFPELPTYDRPITVRHLLTHTSGLRDWGAIVALEGWPRGSRAHTNAHVVQVAARQRALNYSPGDTYSYTNTGYNLLAELVERVSGQSLAVFTRERIFVPLGMTRTSWRDDHRRIVRDRALAYTAGTTPALAMPDESAYGNGGLLTTSADLLRWATALNTAALGPAVTDAMQQRFVLTNGDTISYAMGVNVLQHRGTPELSHSGATGGYRAHLLSFPARQIAVSVLCNGAALNATQIAELLADSILAPRTRQPAAVSPGRPQRITAATAARTLPADSARALSGWFASAEVGGEPYEVATEAGALVLTQTPDLRLVLAPRADGRFVAGSRVVWFDRDAGGRVSAMHIGQDRAWDVRFPLIARPTNAR